VRKAPEIMTPNGPITYHPPVDHVPQVEPEDDGRWVTESMRGIQGLRKESDLSDETRLMDTSSMMDGRRFTTESQVETARLSMSRSSIYADGNPVIYTQSSASTSPRDNGARQQNYVQQLMDPRRLSPVVEDAFSEGRLTVSEDTPGTLPQSRPSEGALDAERARRERLRQLGGTLSSEEQRSCLATLRRRRQEEYPYQQTIPEHEQVAHHAGYNGYTSNDPRVQPHISHEGYTPNIAAAATSLDMRRTQSSRLSVPSQQQQQQQHSQVKRYSEDGREEMSTTNRQEEKPDLDAVRRKRMDERLKLARQQEEAQQQNAGAHNEENAMVRRSSIEEKKIQMQEQREKRQNEERIRLKRLEEKLRAQKRL